MLAEEKRTSAEDQISMFNRAAEVYLKIHIRTEYIYVYFRFFLKIVKTKKAFLMILWTDAKSKGVVKMIATLNSVKE
jgi:hypothetical protein